MAGPSVVAPFVFDLGPAKQAQVASPIHGDAEVNPPSWGEWLESTRLTTLSRQPLQTANGVGHASVAESKNKSGCEQK